MICELPFMGVELEFLIDVVDFDDSKYEWKYSFKSKPSTLGYNSYIKEIIFTIINILNYLIDLHIHIQIHKKYSFFIKFSMYQIKLRQ